MTKPKSGNGITFDGGSYRDPSGFVFELNGRILRTISEDYGQTLLPFIKSPICRHLVEQGNVVPTEQVPKDSPLYESAREHLPRWTTYLEHERVPIISYPYEWSFSMLADAALQQLRIQRSLLEGGYSLKDASAFNTQFVHCDPVFIDIASIEQPARLDIWIAYSQFCRMFLYPLLLHIHKGIRFSNIFLADVEGVEVDQAYAMLGKLSCLKPSLFVDVFMQQLLNRKDVEGTRELKKELSKTEGKAEVQVVNLRRLERKIEKLKSSYKMSGLWSDYNNIKNYSSAAEQSKEAFIRGVLEEYQPRQVLDLGCNTGAFSVMAAEHGSQVIATDLDHDCVEQLYRKAKADRLPILPIVVDLANPSPGIGFMNRERSPVLQRIKGTCIFALALVHHLLITERLPLEAIRDMLWDLTDDLLVIEYIDPQDSMFQSLLAIREDYYSGLNEQVFADVFEQRFTKMRSAPITDAKRTLFLFRKISS